MINVGFEFLMSGHKPFIDKAEGAVSLTRSPKISTAALAAAVIYLIGWGSGNFEEHNNASWRQKKYNFD